MHLWLSRLSVALKKYMKFIGPGLMVSVAYMDPGNYSTAVAAGSAFQYKLLFSILLSNCLAIVLQILSARLGAVTGLDLAANCRENLPARLNMFIYILAEIAIIATDLAEVVGTAIALNILFNVPLFFGVIITVVDVLIVLMAYRPNGPMVFIRIFEGFVSFMVAGTVVCFAIELWQVSREPMFSVGDVLKGFLPNEKVIDTDDRKGGNGLFLSLAILGATVMPHSLYLGSGLVQARLKDYDIKHGYYTEKAWRDPELDLRGASPRESVETVAQASSFPALDTDGFALSAEDYAARIDHQESSKDYYRPSMRAINDTLTYTIVELVVSLFTVALFVNATILIVAGATMGSTQDSDSDSDSDDDSNPGESSDLFTIYHLLSKHISPSAGVVFALALLCSGQSAGVVCTLAGQMVLEGFLRWSFLPVVRRLVTRAIAILPCLTVVTYSGREGLAATLNALQVVLSVLLPVVTAPLIWFTCLKQIMKVPMHARDEDDLGEDGAIKSGQNRFSATEPAIRLKDLRSAHPCAGWDDEGVQDESLELQNLLLKHSTTSAPTLTSETSSLPAAIPPVLGSRDSTLYEDGAEAGSLPQRDDSESLFRYKGHFDMSNGPVMTVVAILIWGFVTCLNLFLIGSMLLGYDVPL